MFRCRFHIQMVKCLHIFQAHQPFINHTEMQSIPHSYRFGGPSKVTHLLVLTFFLVWGNQSSFSQIEVDFSTAISASACDGTYSMSVDTSIINSIIQDFTSNQLTTDSNWVSIGSFDDNMYFEWQGTHKTWQEAQTTCEGYGGSLFCIETAAENAAVALPYASAVPYATVWIGLYQDVNAADYSEPAGGWRWVSGEPVTFTNWQSGEPSGFTENCGVLDWNNWGDKWNDFYGTFTLGFLMEFDFDFSYTWWNGNVNPIVQTTQWPPDNKVLTVHALGSDWHVYLSPPLSSGCNCEDPLACNFNPLNEVNAPCIYPAIGENCFAGTSLCASGTWWNPAIQQCEAHPCVSCHGDITGDNYITISDLLSLLSVYSEGCETFGCTDTLACNYLSSATWDTGDCVYGGYDACGCVLDCAGNLLHDSDANGVCDSPGLAGCMTPEALNFNPLACVDNGQCIFE
jgi:hypothetical protein